MPKLLVLGVISLAASIALACGSNPTSTPPPTEAPAARSETKAAGPESGTKPSDQAGTFTFLFACVNRTLKPCEIIMEFAANVKDRTNGRVDIEITSFEELGLGGPDTLRLLQDGTLEMGEVHGGYVSADFPAIEMAELLGLFKSSEMQEEVFRAIREDEIRMVADQFGSKVISYIYYPDQFFWSQEPLQTAEDFKGLKVRTHTIALRGLTEGLGAEAQTAAFAQVYAALKLGILDVGVGGGTPGHGQRWYEESDYLVGPLTSRPQAMLAMNQDLWDELPPDFQQILIEEGAKAEARNLSLIGGWDQEGVDLNVEEGMEYIPFTPELQEGIRKAALERIIPNWAERAGGPDSDAVQLFNEKVAPIVGIKILPDGTAEEIE